MDLALDKGGIINSTGNALLVDSHKNHKQWYQHVKRLIDNPNLVEDLGERLHETIAPHYNLKTVSKKRADWYKELIRKS